MRWPPEERPDAHDERLCVLSSRRRMSPRRLDDRAPQRPDEIERPGDEQPRVGLGRQFGAAAKGALRVRLGIAREAERRGEPLQFGRRPAAARSRQVGEHDRGARLPSSVTKPFASLSAASATIATHGPERSGVRARSLRTASTLNGTCAPSITTGRRLDPTSMSTRSMRPGRRAAARVRRGARRRPRRRRPLGRARSSRLAIQRAPASATLASSIVASAREAGARGASRVRRAGLQRPVRLRRRVERSDERGPGFQNADLLARDRRCRPESRCARARCWSRRRFRR